MYTRQFAALAGLTLLLTTPAADAGEVSLNPSQDNSIFSEGALASGVGDYIFAGQTSGLGLFSDRRALIQFDVAGNVPAASIINSVTLTMTLSNSISLDHAIDLHRLTTPWGEGNTVGLGFGQGRGAPAAAGDCTWSENDFGVSSWTTAGGDFNAPVSTTQMVAATFGPYVWPSSATFVADVQDMLDNPGSNNGWIVIGDEATTASAKRFDSRENSDPNARPVLTINFTPPGGTGTFCNSVDGADNMCPCDKLKLGGSFFGGCRIAQGVGVTSTVTSQNTITTTAVITGTGFPPMASPSAIMIRGNSLEATPVPFGDGLRCVGLDGFVRLAATTAISGTSVHNINHGAGPGTFHYQIWFRNTPVSFCVTTGPFSGAFNLSNGNSLVW